MTLYNPQCKFCGSNETTFTIGQHGELFVKCHNCMRVYDIRSISATVYDDPKTVSDSNVSEDLVEETLEESASTENKVLPECEYRLPCGVCTKLNKMCLLKDTSDKE